MKPSVLSYTPKEDLILLNHISRALRSVPEIDLGQKDDNENILLSCHMLARACGKIFRLEVQDDAYYPNFNHSWLLTPNENIIDVYPIGLITSSFDKQNEGPRIEPILVIKDVGKWLYIPNKPGRDEWNKAKQRLMWGQEDFSELNGFSEKWFTDSVNHLTEQLRIAM
jgi:hypothetical protein